MDYQDTYNDRESPPRDPWGWDQCRPDSIPSNYDSHRQRSYSGESSQSIEVLGEIHYDSEYSESSQRHDYHDKYERDHNSYSDNPQENYNRYRESSNPKIHGRRKYGLIHEVPLEPNASGSRDYGRSASRERDKSPRMTHRSSDRYEDHHSHSRREIEDRYSIHSK